MCQLSSQETRQKKTILTGIDFVQSICDAIKDKDLLKRLGSIPLFEHVNDYIRARNVFVIVDITTSSRCYKKQWEIRF